MGGELGGGDGMQRRNEAFGEGWRLFLDMPRTEK